MKRIRIAKISLLTGGMLELTAAIAHFVWPFQLNNYGEYAKLSKAHSDLLLLCVIAVGLLLLVFGLLSIYFSYAIATMQKAALVFGCSQAFLFFVRAALEIAFPVRIPMFFINNPATFILPGTIILFLLYLIPVALIKTAAMNNISPWSMS